MYHEKYIVCLNFYIGVAVSCQAQKYAIIDTKYILGKMPEYVDADKKLQAISDQWQKEIDNMQAQLNEMYKNYDAEQYMLSDTLKRSVKMNYIIKKKK